MKTPAPDIDPTLTASSAHGSGSLRRLQWPVNQLLKIVFGAGKTKQEQASMLNSSLIKGQLAAVFCATATYTTATTQRVFQQTVSQLFEILTGNYSHKNYSYHSRWCNIGWCNVEGSLQLTKPSHSVTAGDISEQDTDF